MLNVILWAIAFCVVATTLLPLSNSAIWWVRMWDFPRFHIAMFAVGILLAALIVPVFYNVLLIAMMLVVFVYQAIQIFPYTPFADTEIDLIPSPSPEAEISLMSVNVLMENTRHADLIRLIQREDPDILFLMETDEVWHEALTDVLSRYTTIKTHISNDHYGLIFATRLIPYNVELLWPSKDDTPALKAVLGGPDGTAFNFVGLHPRPPVPGNDTAVRDQQIKDAALMTSSSDRPTICMGDFNDVAWSWTTRRFKRYGGFREPRVGRGMISSFHAHYPFMRLPIDQVFLTENVSLVSFDRLENFGSDHFPMVATVFLNGVGENVNDH